MFHGSMVALVTPMRDDGELDFEALQRLVEFHIENGTDALVAVGTTGESPTLDFDEHCLVMRKVAEYARGRVPVIGGTGSNATKEAIELTTCAMEGGCDAVLLVTPYYNKPTQEGLYQHYKAIAEACPIPQLLYNVPGRTACDLLPETVQRLAEIPNVVGIKEAHGTVQRARDIIERCGASMDVISGDDPNARETIFAGGKGVISVTANVAPRLMHELCAAALRGDRAEAERIDAKLAPLHKILFCEANPIPVKWAVHEMGLIQAGIRLPMTPLSQQFREPLREVMRQVGVL
jgi:4-hydroxy-tetrahydrodipicolinate synthase